MGQLVLVAAPPYRALDINPAYEHTLDHLHCPACEESDRALQVHSADMAGMLFSDAAPLWMRLRAQSDSLRPRTHESTQGYLDALGRFFHALRLRAITPGHLRGYQIARLHNALHTAGQVLHPWQRTAGHSTINHELCVLGQMLTHCRLWHRLKPYYFPLATPGWSPRTILSEEQEEELWKVASRHPEAALAYWVATITNNTTAAGIELRGLRLKHLFLDPDGIPEIYIPPDSVKNNARPRKIALNNAALWAIQQCYKRALQLGSCAPDDYLFPFRTKQHVWIPSRPASRWFLRVSWRKLQKATGFHDLQPHDLRHNCITRLFENDVNPETVQAIAGHVNPKMTEYYSHQRRRVKYAAVLAIETKKKPPLAEQARATGRHRAHI